MYFELGLLSVVITTAYLAPLLLRRLPPGHRTYGFMLLATGAAALAAFLGRRADGPPWLELVGAVAIGAAVFLILVPPILRDLARRALIADRTRLAITLVNLREHLQPGMGAEGERAAMESFLAVREGRVDEAVGALREARRQVAGAAAPENERAMAIRQIDERVVTLFLSGRRYRDAVGYFERDIADGAPLSPPVLVELIRAYCEVGDRPAAAKLLERVEGSPVASDPAWAPLLARARLVFLAFLGRTAAVDALLAGDGALSELPRPSRSYWSGIARLHAGDVGEARRSLEDAVRRSRRDRRAREVAAEVLASVDRDGVAGPHAVSDEVAAFADRIAALPAVPAAARLPDIQSVPLRRMPVTAGLVVANIAVTIVLALVFGNAGDSGTLVRAGANVQSAVGAGEWWRLASSMFLHVGVVHLLVNMYGLWTIGRLVEQLYGSLRFFAIYGGAGLAGAAASFAIGGAHVSAGASGAIFGVLGAALVELAVHHRSYPSRWRRALFRALAFITVAQVMIGFLYGAIDQSAHLGGLLVGGGLGLAMAGDRRRGTWGRAGRALAAVLGAVLLAWYGWAAWAAPTTDWSETLARVGDTRRELDGLAVDVPRSWAPSDDALFDPAPHTVLLLDREPVVGTLDEALADRARSRPREMTFRETTDTVLALPAPWEGRELVGVASGLGGDQRFRLVVFGRDVAGPDGAVAERWFGSLLLPDVLARDASARLAAVIASVRSADN